MLAIRLLSAALLAVAAAGCVNPPGVGVTGVDEQDVEDVEDVGAPGPHQWYFEPMERTTCANGTPAGMGLNLGTSADDLVVYLSGGGACWDETSCRRLGTAANLDVTFDGDQLAEELTPLVEAGLFDRTDAANPWPRATYAYIPYCTADLHTGRKASLYEGTTGNELIHHRGAHNIERILEVLPERFPDVERVWLVGVSAGGYGILWNFDQFRTAFAGAEVHAFADASPWVALDDEMWSRFRDRWAPAIPEGCLTCNDHPEVLPRHLAATYPDSRFAMSVFARDPVLAAYMRTIPASVEKSIETFVDQRWTGPNMQALIAQGIYHETLLRLDEDVRSKEGEHLVEFLHRWVSGWGW